MAERLSSLDEGSPTAAKCQALTRIVRRVRPGLTRYIGSAEDLKTAGIIGSHMIPGPGDRILDFQYGNRSDWDGKRGRGIQQVFWCEGRLAVYCWSHDEKSSEVVQPSWNVQKDGNVVALPTAARKVVKNRRTRAMAFAANIVPFNRPDRCGARGQCATT